MKLIIAGSRSITKTPDELHLIIETLFGDMVSEVISGTSRGVDQSGEAYAEKYCIPLVKMPADWDRYGKRAGPIRNRNMATYADAVLVLYDGKSKGSRSMITEALNAGIKLYVLTTEPN